ncbi:MAG TPA: hypothetical protein VMZ69_06760 [Saprospiraceae bacterium]|nr:hypothetical protein [Saprospiraceae bacterium]
MRYGILLLIIFNFLLACTATEKKTYKLSDEELARLMFDIHFADVILTDITPEQKDTLKTIYWKKMSAVYHLSEEEIINEIDKLESEPEKLMLIIGRVKELSDTLM